MGKKRKIGKNIKNKWNQHQKSSKVRKSQVKSKIKNTQKPIKSRKDKNTEKNCSYAKPSMLLLRTVTFLLAFFAANCAIQNFEECGGIVDDCSDDTAWHNGRLLNKTLASLKPGDTLVIPEGKNFHLMGGVEVSDLSNVTISIDGKLTFTTAIKHWPVGKNKRVKECLKFIRPRNVKFTSSGQGELDGNGKKWWGTPGIGYLERGENRPRLFHVAFGENILVENLKFINSPYWTFWVHNVKGLETRNCHIDARRTDNDGHDTIDMTAFNTDGFDVTGRDVWIHDSTIWCQDDTIAVKDDSQNMLFERIEASGVGITIGSIGDSLVKNITFRDIHMHKPYKGIYTKFREDGGTIEDVLFENIYIDRPSQWPIWIGPAQQSDSSNLCASHPCSICWPDVPFAKCHAPLSKYRNMHLKNVTIVDPEKAPGVIIGHKNAKMENIVFEDVVVVRKNTKKKQYFKCEGVESGIATGKTHPVPPCFEDQTDDKDKHQHKKKKHHHKKHKHHHKKHKNLRVAVAEE